MTDYLLLAHHDDPQLSLVEAQTLRLVERFTMPGRTAVLGVSGSGRYGFAVHRDDHCVTIIDSHTASILATVSTEEQPTHFHAHDNQVVIFNDGGGSVSVFDETALDQPPRMIKATQPDHGSAVIIEDYLLAGHLRMGQVDVYRIGQPEPVQRFDCCPVLHGAAQVGSTALFGCSDGVLLLKKQGEGFEAIKQENPADAPPRTRVGLFATHPDSQFVLGNFGHGLALIDPEQAAMQILPLHAHPLKFSFDETGETAIVLTHDGVLHRLALPSGECITSKAVVAAVEPPKGPDGKARPSFSSGAGQVYIVEPDANRMIAASLTDMGLVQAVDLSDKPSAVIYLHGRDATLTDQQRHGT